VTGAGQEVGGGDADDAATQDEGAHGAYASSRYPARTGSSGWKRCWLKPVR
jgi:hypothetical protein